MKAAVEMVNAEPTGHLTTVSLAAQDEDRTSASVSSIARRWGFVNIGRFAAYHEQAVSMAIRLFDGCRNRVRSRCSWVPIVAPRRWWCRTSS